MAKKSYTLLEYLVSMENKLKEIKKYVDDNLGTDYSELENQVNNLELNFNEFKTSISNTVNTNKSNLLNQLNSLDGEFKTFKTSITNTVNSNNTSLISKVNSLETQFNSFKTSITSTVNSNKSELLTKINNLETDVDDRVTDVENRVTNLENSGGSGGVGGSGVSDGYGEKLLAHYVHNGNKEFHFSSFNYTTCEGTTNKPHGLSSAVEVIVVPNEWSLGARQKGVLSVPIEWVTNEGKIKLVPVDDITLKVTKTDGLTIIPVNIGISDNENVDYSKFHFEETTPWSISNFPTLSNYVRIIIKGYVKTGTYRYLAWKIKNKSNTEANQNYLNILGCPIPTNSKTPPYNCVYGIQNMELDFRDDGFVFSYNNFYEGRRNNFSNLVWDIAKENNVIPMEKNGTVTGGLSYLGNFSKDYSYNSNGTHVYIYDLGGTL